MLHRYEKVSGDLMLVKLPDVGGEWKIDGHPGMAFYFVVPQRIDCRNVCLPDGGPTWAKPEICLKPARFTKKQKVDAALLIGSTGQSFLHDKKGPFTATFKRLTKEGKILYRLLKTIYGEVKIVTLLDT